MMYGGVLKFACTTLNGPLELLVENSHVPAEVAGTVTVWLGFALLLYWYWPTGELPKCSKVDQTISGWLVTLPTKWTPTRASVVNLCWPVGVHLAGFVVVS